jgi:mannose-6-phosphate isomerase-like protein (cupin superfamily)
MFQTRRVAETADAIAPDGSEVRLLCTTARGSMAHFRLSRGAVANAVAHRTVEELWYVVAGKGRMWRSLAGAGEKLTLLEPRVSLTVPVGMHFQFRCDGEQPLDIVAVTMPLWPGPDEAYLVAGKWPPSSGPT